MTFLINTETDLNCWTVIHRLFRHTQRQRQKFVFFFPDFFSPFQTTYLQSTKGIYFTRLLKGQVTKKKNVPVHFGCHHQVKQSNRLLFTGTLTHERTIYMLVSGLQHLMAMVKSLIFNDETLCWLFTESTLSSNISLCIHVVKTKYLLLECLISADCYCRRKETEENCTHGYTQAKIKRHSRRKVPRLE